MCTYTTNKILKVAEKDIVCYKTLSYSRGDYYTPYTWEKVPNSVLEGKEFFNAKGVARCNVAFDKYYAAGSGFIHTCRYKKHAFQIRGNVVYKVVIPKGTKYITGRDYAGHICYASKKIKFIKEVW